MILPADTAWDPAPGPVSPLALPAPLAPQDGAIAEVAKALRSGEPCVLLLNGKALFADSLALAGSVCAGTGARMFSDTFVPRLERGAGIAPIEPLPYFGEQAEAVLEGTRHLILVGTRPPVTFFAYPGKPSSLVPDGCDVHSLCGPEGDIPAALQALAETLGVKAPPVLAAAGRPDVPKSGALDPSSIGASWATHAGERHCRQRGCHRWSAYPRDGGLPAARLVGAHRRRDRSGLAERGGRGGGLPRSQGALHAG